jgi:hypothetical protein
MKFIYYSQIVTLLDEVHPFFKWCGTEFDPWAGHRIFWMKVLTELNRVKFEFGPCPDALLLSPRAVNCPVQCTVDEVHPLFKYCEIGFGQWPVQLYSG